MVHDHRLSRRKFLGVAAGAAAVTALAPMGPALATTSATAAVDATRGNKLIVKERFGTIAYTQRDVPTRLGIAGSAAAGVDPTFGYLGGERFHRDPNDLGPLVPLPGGWLELFEYLAGLGFTQVEFAGYGQNAGNPGGAAPNPAPGGTTTPADRAAYVAYARILRGFLDDTGLRAIGNHGFIPATWPGPGSAGGAMSTQDYNRFQAELEFAATLGMKHMGTGSDPTSANNRNIENWDLASEKWIALNELSLQWDIQMYPHNHSPAYNFLQDGPMVEVTVNRNTGEPLPAPEIVRGESGKRLMEHFLDTTPDSNVIQLDVYWGHVAQHQHRFYYDWNGVRRESIYDPIRQITDRPHRHGLFHAKDGASTGQAPTVGNGYTIVPFGAGDIDYLKMYRRMDRSGADLHYPHSNYEQDSAPGGAGDPGKSLRDSKFSAWHMERLG